MGESRGGEGRAEGPTVIQLLSQVLDRYREDGTPIRRMEVQEVTEGTCSLKVWLIGQPEPEEIVMFGYDAGDAIRASSPIGGTVFAGEED